MVLRKEIYEVEPGNFGYRVYVDDGLTVDQSFKPRVEGFQPMSREEADACADEDIRRIEASHQVRRATLIFSEELTDVDKQELADTLSRLRKPSTVTFS